MSNELKLGHQVLAWNGIANNNKQKGVYLLSDNPNPRKLIFRHLVLINNNPEWFEYAELDPKATNFLLGDEVENPRIPNSNICTYVGYEPYTKEHHVSTDGRISRWLACQYPKKTKSSLTPGIWWIIGNSHSGGLLQTVYVTQPTNSGEIYGYGFTSTNIWLTEGIVSSMREINSARPADIGTEVIPLLEKEAKLRGLGPGVKVKCFCDKRVYTISDMEHEQSVEDGSYWLTSKGIGIKVMKDGQWAEPITPKWEVGPYTDDDLDDYEVFNNDNLRIIGVSGKLSKQQAECIAKSLDKEGL